MPFECVMTSRAKNTRARHAGNSAGEVRAFSFDDVEESARDVTETSASPVFVYRYEIPM